MIFNFPMQITSYANKIFKCAKNLQKMFYVDQNVTIDIDNE